MANVRESMVKDVIIDLPLERIDAQLRKELKKALSRNKGRAHVTFNVFDTKERINAEFISRKYSVLASDELISWLGSAGLNYRINK